MAKVWPTLTIEGMFSTGPKNVGGSLVWNDITERVPSWEAGGGIQYELGEQQVQVGSLNVNTRDEWLNPSLANLSGTLSSATLANANSFPSATAFEVGARVMFEYGTGNAESAWITGRSGSGPYTHTLDRNLTFAHASGSGVTASPYNATSTGNALKLSRRVRIKAVWNSITYYLMDQLIERYPMSWRHQGFYGETKLTTYDPTGLLQDANPENARTQSMLDTGAGALWPMDDEVGKVMPKPYPINGSTAAQVQIVATGSTGGSGAVNVVADGPGIDGENCLEVTDAFYRYVKGTHQAIGGTAGYSYAGWFRPTTGSNGPVTLGNVVVKLNPGAALTAQEVTDSLQVTGPTVVADTWYHVVVGEQRAGGFHTIFLFVNGKNYGGDGVAAANASVTTTGWTTAPGGGGFRGRMAAIGAWAGYPQDTVVTALYKGQLGWAGDKAGERIARCLTWLTGTYMTVTDVLGDGATPLSALTGASGKSLLDIVKEALNTELGYLIPSGNLLELLYWSRDAIYANTTTWSVGEQEVPYEDLTIEYDDTYLSNQVRVTDTTGTTIVQDTTSIADYGLRTMDRTIATSDPVWRQSLAEHLLNRYRQPTPRVTGVTINAATSPTTATFAMCLGAKVGDRMTVKRRTPTGATITVSCVITSKKHVVSASSWVTEFGLGQALPYQPWVLGDATLGVLGTTSILTY